LNTVVFGLRTVVFGSNTVVFGLRTVVFGLRTVVFGLNTVVHGVNTVVFVLKSTIRCQLCSDNKEREDIFMKTTSPFGRGHINDDSFFNKQGIYVNGVVANQAAWGLPAGRVTALSARRAEYEPLYLKVQDRNTRTRADVAAHRDKRTIYEKELREFHDEWIANNSAIPAEQKLILGGRVRDIAPSPGAPITDVPYVKLSGLGGGDIEVRCKVTEDRTMPSMHPDANVVEFRYILLETGDVPPSDPEDCPKGDSSTKAKFVIKAGAKNEGKRLWGFFRWLNNRRPRQEGSWTNAISVIVG